MAELVELNWSMATAIQGAAETGYSTATGQNRLKAYLADGGVTNKTKQKPTETRHVQRFQPFF